MPGIRNLLADSLDGTLASDPKANVEEHRSACVSCAELASDAAGAMGFIERAAIFDPPPALVNRILFEVTNGNSREVIKPSWMERRAGFLLQPRFAMGMAMAVLSLAMVGRWGRPCAGNEGPARDIAGSGGRRRADRTGNAPGRYRGAASGRRGRECAAPEVRPIGGARR